MNLKNIVDTMKISVDSIDQRSVAPRKHLQKEFTISEKEKQRTTSGLTRVVGLTNLGNTCFFNAVLQCLAQTPFLVKVLEDLQKSNQTFVLPGGRYKKPGSDEEIILPPIRGTLEYGNSGNFTQTLQKTLIEMQNPNGQQVYKPSELLNSFKKKTTQCMDGGQHDSHELLRHLLEIVRNEDLKRYQAVILKEFEIERVKGRNNSSEPKREIDDDKKSRIKFYGHQASARLLGTEPVFRGILVSTLECLECYHSSQRTEPFLDLSLPVMPDKSQPPTFKRKNSGYEDASNINSNDISHNVTKAPGKEATRAAKKAAKKERKNIRNLKKGITFGKNDSADIDYHTRIERPENYPASVASDTDVEDNEEIESGNEFKITESGYSSEKASVFASPDSPTESQVSNEVNPLGSLNGHSSLPLIYSRFQTAPTIQENLGTQSLTDVPMMDLNKTEHNPDDTRSDSTNPSTMTVSPKNSLSDSGGMNLAQNGISQGMITVEEKQAGENDKNDLVNFFKPERRTESPLGEILLEDDKFSVNPDGHHSNMNGISKIICGFSEIGINNLSQSPVRYYINEGELSIQSCLNQFTAKELMTGSNKVGCEACTAKNNKGKVNGKMVYTQSTKQYLISKVPAVLILHLKRFQAQRVGFRKNAKRVSFPFVLDLAPACKNHEKPKIYSLYGVVVHSGTLYGGHYVAYVKTRQPLNSDDPRWSFLLKDEVPENGNLSNDSDSSSDSGEVFARSTNFESFPGKWYFISDTRVTEVDENTVLNSEAYLLFYERIF